MRSNVTDTSSVAVCVRFNPTLWEQYNSHMNEKVVTFVLKDKTCYPVASSNKSLSQLLPVVWCLQRNLWEYFERRSERGWPFCQSNPATMGQ